MQYYNSPSLHSDPRLEQFPPGSHGVEGVVCLHPRLPPHTQLRLVQAWTAVVITNHLFIFRQEMFPDYLLTAKSPARGANLAERDAHFSVSRDDHTRKTSLAPLTS